MIDPLRPYWPTNRSLGGLLIRGFFLFVAAASVLLGFSRTLVLATVPFAALAQASYLAFEWMELRRAPRSGLVAAGVAAVIFVSLVVVLFIEGRSVLVLSPR